jgi:hypothetical protein
MRSTNQNLTHIRKGARVMTTNQSNKFSMYSGAASVLKTHADRTAAIPAFAGSYQRFDGLLAQIREKDKERMGKTSGKVAAKDKAEDALVMETIIVSSNLTAYARSKGNTQLKEKAHVSENYRRHLFPYHIVRLDEQIAQGHSRSYLLCHSTCDILKCGLVGGNPGFQVH